MNQLTDKQLIFLDNIVYLDLSNYNKLSLSTTIERILQEDDSYFIREMPEGTDYRAQMYPEEWRRLLTSFLEDESNCDFLNNYRIERFQNNDKVGDYFCACSFVKYSEEDSSTVEDIVVSFRGTYGNAQEWEDNILNACREGSDVMNKSVEYVNDMITDEELCSRYGEAAYHLTVTGHSKGGNRAQYVTILTDQVDRCLSYDGQGFSKEFIQKYSSIIEERKDIITSISSQYDYVNLLLTPIAGTIKYLPVPSDSEFMKNHCPNKAFPATAHVDVDDDGMPIFGDPLYIYRWSQEDYWYHLQDAPSTGCVFLKHFLNDYLNSHPDVTQSDLLELISDVAVPYLALDKDYDHSTNVEISTDVLILLCDLYRDNKERYWHILSSIKTINSVATDYQIQTSINNTVSISFEYRYDFMNWVY